MPTKEMFSHPRWGTVLSIGLNIVRILSLVALILVFVSTIVDMVANVKAVNAYDQDHDDVTLVDCEYIEESSVPIQLGGVFWAYMGSLLILSQTIILALSELGWNTAFFDRYFPVLGSNFGLGILGIFQCLMATQILSHFVEDFTLISAFSLFIVGILNIVLGLIFRESARPNRCISPWRSTEVLPTSQDNRSAFAVFSSRTSPGKITPYVVRQDAPHSDSSYSDSGSLKSAEKAGYGFGGRGEKSAGLGGSESISSMPDESPLPTFLPPPGLSSSSGTKPAFRSSPTAL